MTDLPIGSPLGETPISASQLKTWEQCPRKWAFSKLGRVPKIESPPLVFGTTFHAHAAAWLADGTPPDLSKEGRLFAESIPLLPRPGTCLVEQRFELTLDGVPFVAILDAVGFDPIRAIDHKTCAGRQWSLDEDGLANDVQGILYAIVLAKFFGVDPAIDQWVYSPKRSGNPWVVEVKIPIKYAREKFKPRIETAQKLIDLRRGGVRSLDWINQSIPCNPDACEGMGRFCDAAAHCVM